MIKPITCFVDKSGNVLKEKPEYKQVKLFEANDGSLHESEPRANLENAKMEAVKKLQELLESCIRSSNREAVPRMLVSSIDEVNAIFKPVNQARINLGRSIKQKARFQKPSDEFLPSDAA